MGKNGYLERRKARDTVMQDAIRQTYQQYMTDMLILTLNDPEVMGKDVFGYKRLKRVLDAWGKKYDRSSMYQTSISAILRLDGRS